MVNTPKTSRFVTPLTQLKFSGKTRLAFASFGDITKPTAPACLVENINIECISSVGNKKVAFFAWQHRKSTDVLKFRKKLLSTKGD